MSTSSDGKAAAVQALRRAFDAIESAREACRLAGIDGHELDAYPVYGPLVKAREHVNFVLKMVGGREA